MCGHLNFYRGPTPSPSLGGGLPVFTMKPFRSFSECYCERFKVTPEQVTQEVFRRSLHPHARWLVGLLIFYDAFHFAADYELILSVGSIRRMRDFPVEAVRFNLHPVNHGFRRRKWLLRVSTKRLRSIVRETLEHQKIQAARSGRDFSAVPFKSPSINRALTQSTADRRF